MMNRYSDSNSDQADQAEFLTDHCKDEVGRTLRQELQLSLAAVHPSLAEHAARAERDLALNDVIAGAERIVLRVEEGQHALALIVVQHVPAGEGGAHSQQHQRQHDSHRQSAPSAPAMHRWRRSGRRCPDPARSRPGPRAAR
jgi:hypothetical protein